MSKKKNRKTSAKVVQVTELSLLTEITRLVGLLVRLNLQAMSKDRNQTEMILLLASIGCGYTEIADLLGITPNSVGPALTRANRKKK